MRQRCLHIISLLLLSLVMSGCEPRMDKAILVDMAPPIFPDYIGVTVPRNIAPLNFTLTEDIDYMTVVLKGKNDSLVVRGRQETNFSPSLWHSLLENEKGNDLEISITAHNKDGWVKYPSFSISIAEEPIDSYLRYKHLVPGNDEFGLFDVCERNLETFDVRILSSSIGNSYSNKSDTYKCQFDSLRQNNKEIMEKYHSWSSNGRWVVYDSLNDDRLFARPYISYVDSIGVLHKPFVMPLRRPTHYYNTLKTYEKPILSSLPLRESQLKQKEKP